ncbi:hypothetical protein MY3296_007272 [Beauveria thailandica]
MQEANVHRASSGKVMVQAQTRIYDAVGHATNVRIQEAPNFIFLVSSPQPDTINAACPPVTTRTTITTTTINTTIHPNGRVETKVTKEVAAPAPAPAAAADSASASASRRTLRRAERRRRQKQGVRQRQQQQQQQKQEQEQPEVVVKEEEEDLGITSCRSLNPLNSAVVGRSALTRYSIFIGKSHKQTPYRVI